MVRLFVESRKEMVWLPVVLLMKSGAPCLGAMGDRPKCFDRNDGRVECFVNFCESFGYNWMITEILHD